MHIEILEICASELAVLRHFYGDRLGLPVTSDSAERTLSVTVGKSTLILRESSGFTGRYHFAFNIPKNRLTAAATFLSTLAILLLPDEDGHSLFHFESWNAHSVYFEDPAGNILEFIARHELDNAISGNEPFSASEILNISEIGLPAENVEDLCEQLCTGCGISPYRAIGPAFAALGDAHGLFILVPEGRIWFPNNGVAAKLLPVRISVRGDDELEREVLGVPYRVVPSVTTSFFRG